MRTVLLCVALVACSSAGAPAAGFDGGGDAGSEGAALAACDPSESCFCLGGARGITRCDGDHRNECQCTASAPDSAPPVSDGDAPCSGPAIWFRDQDGDGFGAKYLPAVALCGSTAGYVTNNDDCADEDPRANPSQKIPQKNPITGPISGELYDFNCDGRTDTMFDGVFTCVKDASGCHRKPKAVTQPICGSAATTATSCAGIQCVGTYADAWTYCL